MQQYQQVLICSVITWNVGEWDWPWCRLWMNFGSRAIRLGTDVDFCHDMNSAIARLASRKMVDTTRRHSLWAVVVVLKRYPSTRSYTIWTRQHCFPNSVKRYYVEWRAHCSLQRHPDKIEGYLAWLLRCYATPKPKHVQYILRNCHWYWTQHTWSMGKAQNHRGRVGLGRHPHSGSFPLWRKQNRACEDGRCSTWTRWFLLCCWTWHWCWDGKTTLIPESRNRACWRSAARPSIRSWTIDFRWSGLRRESQTQG